MNLIVVTIHILCMVGADFMHLSLRHATHAHTSNTQTHTTHVPQYEQDFPIFWLFDVNAIKLSSV